MKDWKILNILNKVKNIKQIFHKKEKTKNEIKNFVPLYPNYDSSNDIYVERLQEALKDDRILNIGLTGPYGSGKSSILLGLTNSFNKKVKWLTVSLATFGNKTKNNKNNSTKTEQNVTTDRNGDGKRDLKDLEIGILQQIIYKIKPSKIPLSKIVRIKEEREWLFRIIIAITIYLLNSEVLNKYVKNLENLVKNIPVISDISSEIKIIVFHILTFTFIFWALGVIFRKFNITSISFNGIDLVSESKSESILNKYIDEIIYILKKSKYNIIIFEDIDRFNEPEIFFKLRELNKIINDNEEISKNGKVKFIYAVKDDIFQTSEERTKFFDFILPVIPIVSNNNAQLKFLEILESINLEGKLSDDIIQEVSYFVNDMRVIINICNEFKLYYDKIYKKLNSKNKEQYSIDQLFAIIAYKNINPDDFKNMQYDNGYINQLIGLKQSIAKLIEKDIDNKERQLGQLIQKRVDYIESEKRRLKKDIIKRYDRKSSGTSTVYATRGNIYESSAEFINEATLEEIFESGIMGNNENDYLTIDEIYPENTWRYDYERISNINDKQMKMISEDLEKTAQRDVLKESLSEIIAVESDIFEKVYNEGNLTTWQKNTLSKILKNKMLMSFIRKGYISENYMYYINNIYSENITIEEYNFIASIKTSNGESHYSTKLTNLELINSRLKVSDFENKDILNLDLFNFLLNQKLENQRKNILNTDLDSKFSLMVHHIMRNINDNGNFFFYCMDNVEKPLICLEQILEEASNIWDVISSIDKEEVKEKYIKYLLKYSSEKSFELMNQNPNFISELENLRELDLNTLEKTYKKFIDYKIKFKNISSFDNSFMQIILDNNLYEINNINIKTILKRYFIDEVFDESELETETINKLFDLPNDRVREHIKNNIDDFIENSILNDDVKRIGTSELISIINCNPSIENLGKILEKYPYNIFKIQDITNKKFWGILFKNKKIFPTISNILEYYKEYGITEEIEDSVNRSIRTILRTCKAAGKRVLKQEDFELFLKDILYTTNIMDKNVFELFDFYKNQKFKISSLDFNNISKSRMEYLVQENLIYFNRENYYEMEAYSEELLVEFCQNNIDRFIEMHRILRVSNKLIDKLLNSSINNEYKKELEFIAQKSRKNIKPNEDLPV
ncbi:MAG: hypothetical protein IKL55_03210 [Clostridia bacterium]|nr:hypothetical protein [Clostridia bacterium]